MAKGADAIYSPRGLATTERIAREGISVQGHTGLFPARATQFGGLRTIGITADEALALLQDFRRLEDAGAYCAKVECVAEEALAEIKKHSKLLLVTIGAGTSGDVINLERFAANPALSGAPTHAFTVELKRSGVTLDVGEDQIILDVLDANGIDAAFSCEQGVCGTCVTEIIDGAPDHRDSFLSDKQRAAGKQLCICVSRAKGDTLKLDI